MFEALLGAWVTIFTPVNMAFLFGGVLMGLALGAIPGLGGVIGLTILIPFIFDLPPATAMAMLIGMAAVTTTSDSIPAILFGIPGTVAAQATILDGFPMTQKGEAARALGASFSASAIGGVFGAVVLFASIPILRPLVLEFRSPEFLMLALLGISMVAVLSRGALAKGLAAAGFGLLLTTVGQDPLTGTFRYVYDTDYLWEGLPLIAIALGIFAIPEIIDMTLAGGSVARDPPKSAVIGSAMGKWRGIRDTVVNWVGVMRSSTLGVFVGVIPGLGGTVVDWFAYGAAKQTSKNAETFGSGDVRGVIAVDAASNAKEGGALVTTIAFGVPGSVTMALLLSAFQIQGLIPGPMMLTRQVETTLTMVWGLVLANVIGAIICFAFVGLIAKVAMINVHRMFPVLITVIYLGAFQGRQVMGDLVALLCLGLLGWSMKRGGWPRPPLILGFILGAKIEDSMFLTTERYGWSWILEPLPAFIGLLCLASIAIGIFYQPGQGRRAKSIWSHKATWSLRPILTAVFGLTCIFFVVESQGWAYEARLFPVAIAVPTFLLVAYQIAHDFFAKTPAGPEVQYSDIKPAEVAEGQSLQRAATQAFGWLVGLLLGIWILGFPIAIGIFALLYFRFRAGEKWWVAIATTVVIIGALFLFFDGVLNVIWPDGLIGLGG